MFLKRQCLKISNTENRVLSSASFTMNLKYMGEDAEFKNLVSHPYWRFLKPPHSAPSMPFHHFTLQGLLDLAKMFQPEVTVGWRTVQQAQGNRFWANFTKLADMKMR